MPELPEVETTRRGIEPHIQKQTVADICVRQRQLRWPVSRGLKKHLVGYSIRSVERRGKYLLVNLETGTLLIHLGMSGSLRVVDSDLIPDKHDHVDIVFSNQSCLRLRDPRRFGAVLWAGKQPLQHKLLSSLGPEPLSAEFDTDYLYRASRQRKVAVKQFIMDSKVVVGVGNIYANEALFLSGIRPTVAAGKISRARYETLLGHIKAVLEKAITAGGTTLRDFVSVEGNPGYFKQELLVYGRAGEACAVCKTTLKEIRQGQRSTVYCPRCQR